jgi:hypothetical protein
VARATGEDAAPLGVAETGVLDHDGSEHSQQSLSTIAVTPTLEAELIAAVQAALAE